MPTKKQPTSNLLAVIALSGKQFLVKEGDKIEAEKLPNKDDETLTVKEVLLTYDGEGTQVGTPYIEGTSVTLKLEKQIKDEKIEIRQYKAKSRHRRAVGHRQIKSLLTVTGINLK